MLKVMIVDDMEIMRRQIKRLPVWGKNTEFIVIDEAEDGQEAINKLQIEPVDLLISDIKMPRVDGIELLREVYENDLATCTVFLSEHSEFSFAKEAIQYGIFDYLVKPVKLEELRNLLKKAKDYIVEKETEKIKLKNLEDKLVEKLDMYYPTEHIDLITQYISNGNKQIDQVISNMVYETAIIFENDITKTVIVLQKAISEIFIGVKKNHEWIEKFIYTDFFVDINLGHYNNIDLMKKSIIEILETIINIINKFVLNSKKNPLIKEICMYAIKNIENNISITTISEALFLTKNHIGDIFKQETGMTLGEYITMIKIERAKLLVVDGSLKNYEIAQKLGYKDSEYFSKLFKKHTKLTPIEFRSKNKK